LLNAKTVVDLVMLAIDIIGNAHVTLGTSVDPVLVLPAAAMGVGDETEHVVTKGNVGVVVDGNTAKHAPLLPLHGMDHSASFSNAPYNGERYMDL
jgi:hypothetical protein